MLRSWRISRSTAVLLSAGAFVAGASLIGAAQANAAVGTQPGALTISPRSGPTTTSMTYATTTACPAGKQGSGVVRLVDPGTGQTANASHVNNSVASPFSGSLNATFAQLAAVFPNIKGTTSEMAVVCFSGPSATGTSIAVQDTFVTIDAAGANYTISSSGPTAPTSTQAAASTGGDTIPVGVNVTSGTSGTSGASGAPTAAPATGGGTGGGSNLALATTGAAVALAGGGLMLLARQRRRQGAG